MEGINVFLEVEHKEFGGCAPGSLEVIFRPEEHSILVRKTPFRTPTQTKTVASAFSLQNNSEVRIFPSTVTPEK